MRSRGCRTWTSPKWHAAPECPLRPCGTTSTLRYYEEKGLIAPTGRRGLRRQYDPAVLERPALIAIGRSAGFSLDEIARMFAPDGHPRIDPRTLLDKADELDRTITELTVLRDSLRHTAACPAPSHMECPTFRRMLGAVVSGVPAVPGRRARRGFSRP
ncbi:helix-turn-helix domain-containing protein [Streptomyces populi]